MRNCFLPLILSLIFSFDSLSSGIAIVDGSKGVYFETIEISTIVTVNSQIATVTCTQIFRNNTGEDANFKFAYPLKEKVNPTGIIWFYNNTLDTAEIKLTPQNESIPGSGDGSNPIDPNLTTYLGDFPFYFSPNDTIKKDSLITISFSYVEFLPYFLNKVSFFQKNNFSLVIDGSIEKQYFKFNLVSEREIKDITISGIDATITNEGHEASISYELYQMKPDFDFDISYELDSEGIRFNSLSTFLNQNDLSCDELGNGFFTFVIEPDSKINTESIEKKFVLVIDKSGSMKGDKLLQAKNAASFIVKNLNLGDKFNIIDFGNSVNSFSDELVGFNTINLNSALKYIDEIEIYGNTNISSALSTTVDQFEGINPGIANIILFFTDGKATAGLTENHEIIELVNNKKSINETSVFLYSVGIGEDVNRGLLRILAAENNGIAQFIEPENIQQDLSNLFLSINNPVLLNTKVEFVPNVAYEVYPLAYSNLYKGQQLIVSGRYDTPGELTMVLTGNAFNVPVTYAFQTILSDSFSSTLSFLPKIWAKQKLDELEIKFYGAKDVMEEEQIKDQIKDISQCFQVVSQDFTSFEDTSTETVDFALESADHTIKVFPNPFTNQIRIHLIDEDLIDKRAILSIYDTHMKLVISQVTKNLTNETIIKNLSSLIPGVYFLQIQIDGKLFLIPLLKI